MTTDAAPRPIDFRPEFRRAAQRGLLVAAVAFLVCLLGAIPARAWGPEAMPVLLLGVALIPAVGGATTRVLLSRRAFPAMRAGVWLDASADAYWAALVGEPVPRSADELASRLGGRADDEARNARAFRLALEGRVDEARRAIGDSSPGDALGRARRARTEAILALGKGGAGTIATALSVADGIADDDLRAEARAWVMYVAAADASRHGQDPVPLLMSAAQSLGPRTANAPAEFETGVRRVTIALAAIITAPAVLAALFLLLTGTGR